MKISLEQINNMHRTDTIHFTVPCVNSSIVSSGQSRAGKKNPFFSIYTISKDVIERETVQNVKVKFQQVVSLKYGKSEADLHQHSVVNNFNSFRFDCIVFLLHIKIKITGQFSF